MAKQNHREKSSNRPADEHHLIKLEKQASCRDRPQPAWAKRKSQRRREFLALGLILGLAGCASVGVRNPTQGAANPRSPSQIFVAEFDAGKGIFQVNRSGDELVAFEQKTADALADHLVADLSKSVVPASRQNDSSRPRGDAWLITGEFVRVNQGSRALRGLIGLGAGGTKMETIVRVYDLSGRSKEPVLQFETTGGSNAEPGAIFGGAFGALPHAIRNAGLRGVSDDTARTAREITAMVGDYYTKHGGQLYEAKKSRRSSRHGERSCRPSS